VARYDVHFVNHGDRVYDAVVLEFDSDEEAIREAHRINVPSIGAGFDVWHEHRLVYRHRNF
jgi:hypothetical protein